MRRPPMGEFRESRRRLARRKAQLPSTSKLLYSIEHYSSLPGVALAVALVTVAAVAAIVTTSFPSRIVTAFDVVVAALTLVMVFSIQHTQGREQAATQRKLDELLRALPGADDRLMLLEEAPQQVMFDVEAAHREVAPDTTESTAR